MTVLKIKPFIDKIKTVPENSPNSPYTCSIKMVQWGKFSPEGAWIGINETGKDLVIDELNLDGKGRPIFTQVLVGVGTLLFKSRLRPGHWRWDSGMSLACHVKSRPTKGLVQEVKLLIYLHELEPPK